MDHARLKLLFLAPFPPSPPTFGAQRRAQGLMAALARRHEITGVSLLPPDRDAELAERSMREYCAQVALVPTPDWNGPGKRLRQSRSLFSSRSFLRQLYDLPALRRVLRDLLSTHSFDVITVELPFLAFPWLRSLAGARAPRIVVDEHNIEFDLARQQARGRLDLARNVYNAINWRRIRREEIDLWAGCDGVAFCSAADEARARALVPSVRAELVPNAVDVEYFQRRATDPVADGRTVLFFGALDYFPNEDGLRYLMQHIWPLVEKSHPHARLKIVGQHPTREVLSYQGPRVDVVGRVDDLRPHLAGAAVSIAPLRIGGGTRFKILEAMAMATPVVSTSVGAEGIEGIDGRHLLLGDDPPAFASALGRVMDDPALGARLGREGRALVEERYSWSSAAQALERLYRRILAEPRSPAQTRSSWSGIPKSGLSVRRPSTQR